ncbi:MAG: hypothetical protein AAGI01_09485 [Myxococcota bacterium]
MDTSRSRQLFCAWLLVSLHAAPALSEDAPSTPKRLPPPKPLKTSPPDLGYGETRTEFFGALPADDAFYEPVDRRLMRDLLAGHNTILSTAALPKERTLAYTTHMLLGHQLTWGIHERVSASGMVLVSPGEVLDSFLVDYDAYDRFATGAVKVSVLSRRNLDVTLQPHFVWRVGMEARPSREFGVGLDALVDLKVSRRFIIGGGLKGYVPTWHEFTFEDTSACTTRQDYRDARDAEEFGFAFDEFGNLIEPCVELRLGEQDLPPGGRFLLGYAWAAFHAESGKGQPLTFKVEAISGLSRGTVLDLEGALWGAQGADIQRRRYAADEAAVGALHGVPVAFGASVSWAWRSFGVQSGVLVFPSRVLTLREDAGRGLVVLPTLALTYRFDYGALLEARSSR